MKLSKKLVSTILETIDAGLVQGLGAPVPGKMCVEAAICYALGLPHGDDPGCVSAAVRSLKIALNDAQWSSNEARAKGMRRLAIAQLGTKENFNETEFAIRVSLLSHSEPSYVAWTNAWLDGSDRSASAARAAAWAAESAARSAAWAAWSAEYQKHADKLVELLEGADR